MRFPIGGSILKSESSVHTCQTKLREGHFSRACHRLVGTNVLNLA